jgi:hypothetical protein
MFSFVETLRSAGLLHPHKLALTLAGVTALASMRDKIRTGTQAFVAMHFAADLRPSVYFEAGFAQGLDIPVLLTCHESEQDQIHFDLRQFPRILWSNPEQLARELTNTIRGLGLARNPPA